MNDDELRVNLEIYPPESDDVKLRQIAFGLQPLVLIEPVEVDDDVEFHITASLMNQEELAQLIDLLSTCLANGEEV